MIWTLLFSASFIIYAYAGYPIILTMLGIVISKRLLKSNVEPEVTLIIAAHNEEKRITQKLDNTLQVVYPRNRIEIIVTSDCSTDGTDEIVRSYSSRGVRLVRTPERKGKENAQLLAIQNATSGILVFSDVSTTLQPDGIKKIVGNFADPSVGCVSSIDRFIDEDGKISGEGAYVRYEMFLRKLETRVNTVVGLSGSFFAARREVCTPWSTDLPSDFNTLLNTVKKGLRGVSDPESVGFYKNIRDERKEHGRKVRTVMRGISVFMRSLYLLNPLRYGLFSWQLFSHKMCRWLVPYAMIAALISNGVLAGRDPFYLYLFIGQCSFYSVALLGLAVPVLRQVNLIRIPMYFLIVNASILEAWFRYVRGERKVTWAPSQR